MSKILLHLLFMIPCVHALCPCVHTHVRYTLKKTHIYVCIITYVYSYIFGFCYTACNLRQKIVLNGI